MRRGHLGVVLYLGCKVESGVVGGGGVEGGVLCGMYLVGRYKY